MLRPNFVRSQVGDLATFERHVSHLIQSIPKDNSTVDLSDKFFRRKYDEMRSLWMLADPEPFQSYNGQRH